MKWRFEGVRRERAFPTNPINALEASLGRRVGNCSLLLFPTNPINALEASLVDGLYSRIYAEFPTNPINALEARKRV